MIARLWVTMLTAILLLPTCSGRMVPPSPSPSATVIAVKTTALPVMLPTSTPVTSNPIVTNIYYVSTTGLDTNPGSLAQPWKTIQKAANTLLAGDTVTVLAGNYSTQRVKIIKSGTQGKPITFKTQGNVVMKGFSVVADYVVIDGFEIANTNYARWDFANSSGIYLQGGNNLVENNYIHDVSLIGIYLYGDPTDQRTVHDNIIRDNKITHSELVGIHVNGKNNIIEENEVTDIVQCIPSLTMVEDVALDNPNHNTCPNYPRVSGLDSDFMRFFGTGHIFRNNFLHDTFTKPPLVVDSHIDCWQTWASTLWGSASYITFDRNICDNLPADMNQLNYDAENGFMLANGVHHLTITNNILRVYGGINATGEGGANHLYIYNNLFINNLLIIKPNPNGMELSQSAGSIVRNNIFYNQSFKTVEVDDRTSTTEIGYNIAYNSNGILPPCISYNDVCFPLENHNLWGVNPQFINPTLKDYHLQAGSPAIDAGMNVGITVDFDGNSRPQGPGFDIGAFEYSGRQ